jgi:hypothetical protein
MASRPSSEEIRSLLYDRFEALLQECEQVMDNAAYGQAVHDLDDFLFTAGRALLNEVYQHKLQERIQGFAGMERELLALQDLKEDEQRAVSSLLEYLSKHKERLSAGRAIGSGLIEGACKNLVKRRLRQTRACWRVERANRIAVICATLYSHQWKYAWKDSA